jgi:ABC-type multidrug transport system ATPase subunit
VLTNCSGYALPGQTLYIMGASGAGKTSLMNAVSDRIAVSRGTSLTGERLINDNLPLTSKLFGSCAVYVMQDDVLFHAFTVKEALTFAARLKLNIPIVEQDQRITNLIHRLGLDKCQNTVIGNDLQKTISGGERKRTSIGVELITDPSVILLEEPTSGLDSFMAKSVCKLLQDLAHNEGKTIIATIHQPPSQAFMYFDRLLLMCDGYTVYQGLAN